MKNLKRFIFSALLLLAIGSPLAAYDYRDFENHLTYQAYVAGKGWLPLVAQGEVAGAPGEARAMCAIRIYATDISSTIDEGVFYRVHLTRTVRTRRYWGLWTDTVVSSVWTGWKVDGLVAGLKNSDGSVDESYTIDDLEISVGNPVPEYAMYLLTYAPNEGWRGSDSLMQPPGVVEVNGGTFGQAVTGFEINVWPGWGQEQL